MDIFSIFTLCGGLAFFLYGMHVMSDGLEKTAGGKLKKILRKMTDNPIKGLLLGAGITIAIQSSSAMTVMLVGLVNSGIMQLGQTIGVIMGSNIGTTLTAWLLSLTGIDSDNILIKLLKPSSFSPIIALVGIILLMVGKKAKQKDIGRILIGFSVLMFGMNLMSDSMSPLADSPEFEKILIAFNNPLLGILVGAVVTGVIQSSAASVGILQALSLTGGITYAMAIPIIMGQNIGTCATALISSIGVNKNARRVAAIHVYFNIFGTAICLTLFYIAHAIFKFEFVDTPITPVNIALVHSIFNIATTVFLFPFTKILEKLAVKTVKDKAEAKQKAVFIDDRLLLSPALAIAECQHLTKEMAETARTSLMMAVDLIDNYSSKNAEKIYALEQKLDDFEDSLGTFLVKISSKELSDADSNTVSILLHTIGDFERIGDHAVSILKIATEMHDKEISFSDEAKIEFKSATEAILEILDITMDAFRHDNVSLALQVEPLEQVIDTITTEIKTRHINRLRNGACTIELGFILSDLLNDYGRVSDHCSNIAVCIIQINHSVFDTHEYLNDYKNAGHPEFIKAFDGYKAKYQLPSKKA